MNLDNLQRDDVDKKYEIFTAQIWNLFSIKDFIEAAIEVRSPIQ